MRASLPVTAILIFTMASAAFTQPLSTPAIVTSAPSASVTGTSDVIPLPLDRAASINSGNGRATENQATSLDSQEKITDHPLDQVNRETPEQEIISFPAEELQTLPYNYIPPSLTLTIEKLIITDLLFVFIDLEAPEYTRIIHHGKVVAKDLTQGHQEGTYLSGRLSLTLPTIYAKLLFRAKIKCDRDNHAVGYMHVHLYNPGFPGPQAKQSANVFSQSDCSDNKIVEREVIFSMAGYL